MKRKHQSSGIGKLERISTRAANQTVGFETKYLRLLINARALQIGLIDKTKGINYLRCPTPLWKAACPEQCARVGK